MVEERLIRSRRLGASDVKKTGSANCPAFANPAQCALLVSVNKIVIIKLGSNFIEKTAPNNCKHTGASCFAGIA